MAHYECSAHKKFTNEDKVDANSRIINDEVAKVIEKRGQIRCRSILEERARG